VTYILAASKDRLIFYAIEERIPQTTAYYQDFIYWILQTLD